MSASALRIVHTESSCGWGGQELRILNESQGLIARGHEVCIAAPDESRLLPEARRRGIPVHPVPIARKAVSGFRALRRFLREREIDIVNSHSSTDTWLAALAVKTLDGRRPRLVRTRHISAAIPRSPASRWLYRKATAHVVTTGEMLRRQVIAATGLEARRVTSVPTGVDLSRYAPGDLAAARARVGLPRNAFVVGIVATLRSWKGHRYLVDAAAQMPDVTLAVVGGGPGAPYLREQIGAIPGLGNRVVMADNQEDVVPWLQSFDVFALPSYANEGVPQALMQAMACRLPIVTTAVGAIPEIVRDGETGLIVTPRDTDALRAALMRLRDEPALRERLAQAAYRQARARFDVDAMLDGMEAVFRTVTAGQ